MQCWVGVALSEQTLGHRMHHDVSGGSWVVVEEARGHGAADIAPRTVRLVEGVGERVAGNDHAGVQGAGQVHVVAGVQEVA